MAAAQYVTNTFSKPDSLSPGNSGSRKENRW
nr:MAG TPA: hypothetical protein [Caudoviricetes sp.]